MDEFFLNLLVILAETIGEVFLEVFGEAIIALLLRAIGEPFVDSRPVNPLLAGVGYFLLGLIAGGLSLLIFPHPLVRPSRVHGISLVVSPLVTGCLMSLIGAILRRHGKRTTQIESFGYGYVFAFGMALIRFFFVK